MRIKFSQIIDLVLALSAITIALVVAVKYLGPGRSSSPPSYRIGESISKVAGIDFAQNDRTLLLVLRSACHFCTESMPFYRRLVAEKGSLGPIALVALSTDDGKTLANYLRQNGLQVDRAVTVKRGGSFKASATPTIILVDRNQRVAGVWTGQLSKREEDALLKAVCVNCTVPIKGG